MDQKKNWRRPALLPWPDDSMMIHSSLCLTKNTKVCQPAMFMAGMAGRFPALPTALLRTCRWIFFHSPLGKTSENKRWLGWQKLAGLEKLRDSRPEAVERPGAVAGLERNFCHHFVVRLLWKHSLHPAGLSLGEYTALCAAGVFTFEEGLTWFVAMKLFVQTANDGRTSEVWNW